MRTMIFLPNYKARMKEDTTDIPAAEEGIPDEQSWRERK